MGSRSVLGMTATVDAQPVAGWSGGDAVLGYLAGVLAAVGGLASGTGQADDGMRIDRIAVLEKIKAAVAAA